MFDCKTKTHQQCVFPFESDSKKYHSCSNEVGFGGQLHCAIDDKSLSFGVCGSDCPGGTKNSYSYKLFVLMQNFILKKVCRNDYGLCNIFGGVNCSSCGTVCKMGFEGNQCQTCQRGFYVSNGVTNGEVDSVTGVGPTCEGIHFYT